MSQYTGTRYEVNPSALVCDDCSYDLVLISLTEAPTPEIPSGIRIEARCASCGAIVIEHDDPRNLLLNGWLIVRRKKRWWWPFSNRTGGVDVVGG